MISPSFTMIDERSPVPIKRKIRRKSTNYGEEPAITVLSSEPGIPPNTSEYIRSSSPGVYRTVPTKAANNKAPSSFVILGEMLTTPVQSRPPSPSGRVSPFRGHGFKSPVVSRAPSPSDKQKKSTGDAKTGLPPKSPRRVKPRTVKNGAVTKTNPEIKPKPSRTPGPVRRQLKTIGDKSSADQISKNANLTETSEDLVSGSEKTKSELSKAIRAAADSAKIQAVGKLEHPSDAIIAAADAVLAQSRNEAETNGTRAVAPIATDDFAKPSEVTKTDHISTAAGTKTNGTSTISDTQIDQKITVAGPKANHLNTSADTKTDEIITAADSVTDQIAAAKGNKADQITGPMADKTDQITAAGGKKTNEVIAAAGIKTDQIISNAATKSDQIITTAGAKTEETTTAVGSVVSRVNSKSDLSKSITTSAIIVEVKEKDAMTDRPTGIDPPVRDQVTPQPLGQTKPEKLVPCLQPDKCNIAPPTMASPSPIITSAINAPSITSGAAMTKTTESSETGPSTVTTTSLNAVTAAATISGNLARRSHLAKPTQPEVTKRVDEQKAKQGLDQPLYPAELAASMPPNGGGTVAINQTSFQKAQNNSDRGDVISTSNLIKVDSEMELLSANRLRDSPPRRLPGPAWSEERLVNGSVPSPAAPKGRLRQFFKALWAAIKYLLCCRCILDCFRKLRCCRVCRRPRCCRRSEDVSAGRKSCCPSSNCRNPFGCCGPGGCFKCKKPKCCEGSKCCRDSKCCRSSKCCDGSKSCGAFKCCRSSKCCKDSKCCSGPKCCNGWNCCKRRPKDPQQKRNCCAKPNCSCKDCCAKMKYCCLSSGDKVNNFCRGLFCLNMMCCQRCLRKCCKPCHRMKCCQKGGCCSCFNPNVKRERPKLDKRGSTQSKSGIEKLDPVLVEHVSMMKAAIPVLPTCLATLCLIMNLLFPGSGTFTSGALCLCFGKPRFSVSDTAKNRMGSFCVNLVIGIAQLFTVVFCLVGWGWSIWWGVIMYKLSRKQRRIKMAERSTKEANMAASKNQGDVEKG